MSDLQWILKNVAELTEKEKETLDTRIQIRPLSPEEKLQKCASCHHLKRYHLESGKCKYESCAARCKGFALRAHKSSIA